MSQVPVAPPPPSNNATLDRWLYLLWRRLTQSGQILWASLDFTGSNLTDLATRNHADLQNINTTSYTHLTSTQATDLTDAGDSTLHYHATDRDSANFTGTNWTDLTDAGDSTLHYHATDRARGNHTGTQLAATISDFAAAVGAVATPVTVTDSASVNLTLVGQDITADVLPAGVDHSALGSLNSTSYYHLTQANHTDLTDGNDSTLHYHATDRDRANHSGTQTAATISDFDAEVSNNSDVAANTSARHAAVTVSDSTSIDLTLTGQQISAAAIFGTTAGTVAEGNHTHSIYQPLDTQLTAIAALADGVGALTNDGAGNFSYVAPATTPSYVFAFAAAHG